MTDFMVKELEALGCEEVRRVALGDQELEGQTLKLPDAVLASYGNDPKKVRFSEYEPKRFLRALTRASSLPLLLRASRSLFAFVRPEPQGSE